MTRTSGEAVAMAETQDAIASPVLPLPRLLGRTPPPSVHLARCISDPPVVRDTTAEAVEDLVADLEAGRVAPRSRASSEDSAEVGPSPAGGGRARAVTIAESADATPIPVLSPVSEANEAPAMEAHRTQGSFRVLLRMTKRISSWRMPSTPGSMPKYIQRNFRAKTFCLLSIQFAIIFAEMLLVESLMPPGQMTWTVFEANKVSFYFLGVLVLAGICMMHVFRDNYPMNYLLLAVVTLAVGAFWGLASVVNSNHLYNQLIAIMCLTMVVATPLSIALSRKPISPECAVISSLLAGWLLASGFVLLFDWQRGAPMAWSIAAMWVVLLLIGTLLFNAGVMLVRGNPDHFLQVIIIANATMLVVVSVPFLLLVACILKGCAQDEEEAEARGEAGGEAEAEVPQGMVMREEQQRREAQGPMWLHSQQFFMGMPM